MKRKPPLPESGDSADDSDVPEEIAQGPVIPVWCDPELLERLESTGSSHPDRAELMLQVMLCARRNWSKAIGLWSEDARLTLLEARRMITHRKPYWP